MLQHFLTQQIGLTQKQQFIFNKLFMNRRRYNGFHLDCEYTKRRLCYCKKNPLSKMSQTQKAQLWRNSYMKPYQFYAMQVPLRIYNRQSNCNNNYINGNTNTSINISNNNNKRQVHSRNQMNKQSMCPSQDQINVAGRQLAICVKKIKLLSKEQLASFIREKSKKARRAIVQSQQYQ